MQGRYSPQALVWQAQNVYSPCQEGLNWLLKKGTPASAPTDTGAGTARLTPPCTVACKRSFFDPDPCPWAGVNCYCALCADNRTKATAISRTKTIRMAGTLLFRLRRAKRMVGGQPCENPYSATHFKSKARRRESSGFAISDRSFPSPILRFQHIFQCCVNVLPI